MVTGVDLVDVVAGALEDHQFSMFTADGYCICTCEATIKGTGEDWNEFPAHQARAVLDALAEAGTVKWGVENDDGPATTYVCRNESEARRMAAEYGATLVSRLTLPWTAVGE